MFSHIIIFGSSLPELLGGHSLCAIICGRVLMSHTHRCHSPLLITMTEFPRRSKATCPPAESKDGGSGSADAVWCCQCIADIRQFCSSLGSGIWSEKGRWQTGPGKSNFAFSCGGFWLLTSRLCVLQPEAAAVNNTIFADRVSESSARSASGGVWWYVSRFFQTYLFDSARPR
jgi:hypothetical protein